MGIRVMHILSGDLWGGSESQMLTQLSALKYTQKAVVHGEVEVEFLTLLLNKKETWQRYCAAELNLALAEEDCGVFDLLRKSLEIAAKFRPQIIVTHGYKEAALGAILALRLRAKLITTYHGAPEPQKGWKHLKDKVYSCVHQLISRFVAHRIVTVSNALAKELGFANLSKTRVIHNVVPVPDQSIIKTVQPVEECKLKCQTIAVVGRLYPVKRFDIAIQAFSQVLSEFPECQLLIAGDGPLRDELECLVGRLKVSGHVQFLGFRRDAQRIIEEADVFLLTSDNEGIPTVILERISVGRPLVSSDLPGIREIIEQVPGYPAYLAEPGDASGFASGIINCLQSPERRYSAADIWSRFGCHFFANAAVEKHLKIYSEIVC